MVLACSLLGMADNQSEKLAGKKILLVEDDEFISSVYLDRLDKAGFTTFLAATTVEAQKILNEQAIQFILLDVMLPDESGVDLLKRIKKDEKWQSIPVMVLSNLSDQEFINEVMDLGAVDYIIKATYAPSDIVNKVISYIQG